MKVLKAGCILINQKTKKIALVYRKKHDDYSFPKGHLEKGETLQECAIRETEEETGRSCHLVSKKELKVLKFITPREEDVENYFYLAIDDGPTKKEIAEKDKEVLIWKNIEEVEETLSYQNLKEFWREVKEQVKQLSKEK